MLIFGEKISQTNRNWLIISEKSFKDISLKRINSSINVEKSHDK